MVRGLYTSAMGMMTQMQRMDVVSNNIANADTTGYKKDQVASKSFTEAFMNRLNDPDLQMLAEPSMSLISDVKKVGRLGLGLYIDELYTDFTSGTLQQTNAALDIAIEGNGFFSIQINNNRGTGTQEVYTRDGSFALKPDGDESILVTKDGGIVLGENGPIRLPNGPITIDDVGRIYVNEVYVDQLKMMSFSNLKSLRKMQDNYYRQTRETETENFAGRISQGFLENSNVNSVKEMVEMIALSRAYETNSRMITIHDTILGRTVTDIARRG